MTYRYVMAARVERYVSRLERRLQQAIGQRLRELCEDPYNREISKPLHGPLAGQRSSDLNNLRIIYEVDDGMRVLAVLAIGSRGDIYKR